MKMRHLIAVLLLAAAGPASASVFNLGNLTVPGVAPLGNVLFSAGSFSDTYNFSIGSAADTFAAVWEIDPRGGIEISNLAVSISGGSFDNLAIGSYSLYVSGLASGSFDLWNPINGYGGILTLVKDKGSTAVPEPGTLALFALALLGAAVATRRSVRRF